VVKLSDMSLSEPKTKKGEIARLILAVVGVSGIVLIGAVAPGLVYLLPTKHRSRFSSGALDQSMNRLKSRGLLKKVRGKTGWRLELTEKGQAELLAFETKKKLLKKPWRWDKKWRLLIFDIAESKKKVRDQVRHFLRDLGFHRLQDSVWVYPYECEDVLELLRTKFRIRHEAVYIRAEKIGKDRWLREIFGLN